MKNNIFLTIICVTYNAEKFIKSTIESISLQSFNNFQVLFVDGLSSDNTIELINGSNLKDYRVISEKDFGIYDAMNKGILNSNTEWLIFMNAGDIFASNYTLELLFQKINNNSLIVYGDTIVKGSGKIINSPRFVSKYFFYSNTLCHQSVLINKKVFSLIGLHDLHYKIIGDRDFFYRASCNNILFQKVDVLISIWDPIGFSYFNQSKFIEEEKYFRRKFSFFSFPIIYLLNKLFYVQK
jgi:glycosyltransferase involved in cell wall biosynthesis